MTELEKRRRRDAKRRERELKEQHGLQLAAQEQLHREKMGAAMNRAREEGHKVGTQHGAGAIRQLVLDHAGSLFKQGKDSDANAVRLLHGLLPETV